jgi:hypothetical protein
LVVVRERGERELFRGRKKKRGKENGRRRGKRRTKYKK